MENNSSKTVEQNTLKMETPSQRSYDKIITLAGGEKSSHLEQYNAARKYLLIIRENGNRLSGVNRSSLEMKENHQEERTAAKLEEYFKLELDTSVELMNRRGELERLLPGISDILTKSEPGTSLLHGDKYITT